MLKDKYIISQYLNDCVTVTVMNTLIWLGMDLSVKEDYDFFYDICGTSPSGTSWKDIDKAVDFCFDGRVSQLIRVGLNFKDIYNKLDGDNAFIVFSEDRDIKGELHAFFIDKRRKTHPTLRCVGYIDDPMAARWFEHEQLDNESKIIYCIEIADESNREAEDIPQGT